MVSHSYMKKIVLGICLIAIFVLELQFRIHVFETKYEVGKWVGTIVILQSYGESTYYQKYLCRTR